MHHLSIIVFIILFSTFLMMSQSQFTDLSVYLSFSLSSTIHLFFIVFLWMRECLKCFGFFLIYQEPAFVCVEKLVCNLRASEWRKKTGQ